MLAGKEGSLNLLQQSRMIWLKVCYLTILCDQTGIELSQLGVHMHQDLNLERWPFSSFLAA